MGQFRRLAGPKDGHFSPVNHPFQITGGKPDAPL